MVEYRSNGQPRSYVVRKASALQKAIEGAFDSHGLDKDEFSSAAHGLKQAILNTLGKQTPLSEAKRIVLFANLDKFFHPQVTEHRRLLGIIEGDARFEQDFACIARRNGHGDIYESWKASSGQNSPLLPIEEIADFAKPIPEPLRPHSFLERLLH